jgi:DNA-binding NtrC family response regulator
METIKVLMIEDSPTVREYLGELVEIMGYGCHPLEEKREFLNALHRCNPDLVLLGPSNQESRIRAFSEVLKKEKSGTPILVVLDGKDGTVQEPSHNNGNIVYLGAGFDPKWLKQTIQRLVQEARNSDHRQLDQTIIGQTPEMIRLKKHVVRLAKSDIAILITGESGTGKELIARAVHKLSSRATKPFVKVNSAALPSNLLESELFGYERGAFTGAVAKKPGKFEMAHSGTILLDEIGEIPLAMQAKLLQVLQDNEYSALGSITNTKVDTRVLAATNANLTEMVAGGRFRSDLYFRLNVVSLHVPPLRERRDDIDLLSDYFLKIYSERYGKPYTPLAETIRERFYRYSWPGNVRELESAIQGMIVLGFTKGLFERMGNVPVALYLTGDTQGPAHEESPQADIGIPVAGRCLKKACKAAVKKAETEAIMNVLFHTRWNRRKAATCLEISYKALLNKIKEYGIEKQYRDLVKKEEEQPEFENSDLHP